MAITIWKELKDSEPTDYIYVCVCDYTTEKYKRKMCYHQKNNLDVKTFERPKNIKKS